MLMRIGNNKPVTSNEQHFQQIEKFVQKNLLLFKNEGCS